MVAENGDIKIEVTRPERLREIVRLIETAKDDQVPPKLSRLIGVVGRKAGTDELGALAEKDAEFAELLREVLQESANGTVVVHRSFFTRVKNDWSRKKKTTVVFAFVVISTGGITGVFTLGPDRGSAETPGAQTATASPTTGPPTGGSPSGSVPALPSIVPAPPLNLPKAIPAPPVQQPNNNNPVQVQRPQGESVRLETTASQVRGLPGTSVNFYGTGFQGCPDRGHRTVNILWDGVVTGSAVPIEADGRFGVRFTVPEDATVGEHYLYGQCTDDTGLWARTTYTVTSALVVTANPAKLRGGQVLSVRGTNFDGCPDYGDRTVNVSISAMGLNTTAPINSDGTIVAQFTIPNGTTPNDYDVVGQCRDGGQWARGIFTVLP
jgi:hypothetical protein